MDFTAAVAASVKPSLASLRSTSHRDAFGNPIGMPARLLRRRPLTDPCVPADPDRSNPTRSRWERPLDTIRSFEAAIDGGYDRKSFIRSGTDYRALVRGDGGADISSQNPTPSPTGTAEAATMGVSHRILAPASAARLTRHRQPGSCPAGRHCRTPELGLHALFQPFRPKTGHARP